jgi:hypothetical protein
MLDGQIDWQGLPLVAEFLGITDIEQLIRHLIEIRTFQRSQNADS